MIFRSIPPIVSIGLASFALVCCLWAGWDVHTRLVNAAVSETNRAWENEISKKNALIEKLRGEMAQAVQDKDKASAARASQELAELKDAYENKIRSIQSIRVAPDCTRCGLPAERLFSISTAKGGQGVSAPAEGGPKPAQ